jgi:hypothetical protein
VVVEQRGREVQVGGVPDRRLCLVGQEVDPVCAGERGHVAQAGEAAGLHDVRLHDVHARVDQAPDAAQGVFLLAGGDRDVERGGDTAEAIRVVVGDRLLEPGVAQLLERPPDPDRPGNRVRVVGVEGEREVVTDQLPDRPRFGDVAGEVASRRVLSPSKRIFTSAGRRASIRASTTRHTSSTLRPPLSPTDA